MRRAVNAFPDCLLIGEIYLPIERLVAYYGRNLDGLHLPFNFSLLSALWDGRTIAKLITEYEAALPTGGWPNWVLGNHDRPRVASRVGRQQAHNAAMLLLTLRGTPTIYYGDEIGMEQVGIAPHEMRDPLGRNVAGFGLGRDGCRTPMPWDGSAYAGFSTVTPWLPLSSTYPDVNVGLQRRDPKSIYHLYRRLIDLRRERKALSLGTYKLLFADGNLLVYLRQFGTERIVIALNLGSEPTEARFEGSELTGSLLISSISGRDGELVKGSITLRPNEGVLIELPS
jgi:alpha-glucosidase